MGQGTVRHRAVILVQRCSHSASQSVPEGHPSISWAQGPFVSDLIDCCWLALMDARLLTDVWFKCSNGCIDTQRAHWISHTHFYEFTHLLDTLTLGLFYSLHIPLAVSHWRPQLLLISQVTRHSRWASALGGTAADVVEKQEEGGGGFSS